MPTTIYTITDEVGLERSTITGELDDVMTAVAGWFDVDAEHYTDPETGEVITVGATLDDLKEAIAQRKPLQGHEAGLGLKVTIHPVRVHTKSKARQVNEPHN